MSVFRRANLPASSLTALLLALAPPALAQEEGAQMPPPAVIVAPAEFSDFNASTSFTGRLVAVQKVDIRARVTGFLESVDFTEGAHVTAGDDLFNIESDSYEAALEQIEGQIVSAQAERDLAELERDRQQELVARQASPQRNLDQAEAAIGTAEGTLITLNGQKRQAELNLSYTTIHAPFDGIIGLTQYDVGALVGPDTGGLVTLTRADPIFADFAVSTRVIQNYRAAVDRGEAPQQAIVTLSQANGTVYSEKGEVNFIDSEVAEGTDTILVRAKFDNADFLLRDGEFVVVGLENIEETQALTIPAQAVSRDLSGNFVMVVGSDDTVERRQIDTAGTVMGRTEIRSGLEEGEMVITEGLNKVRPGIKVDAAEAGQAAPDAAPDATPASSPDGAAEDMTEDKG